MTEYTPTHEASDLSGVVIDAIVEMGVNLLPFAGLIVLVGLYVFARRRL